MDYGLKEVVNMMKVYHELEYEAKLFLSISAFAMKRKDAEIKSAQKTLLAIEKYKKLPSELRNELELDKNAAVSNLVELEKLCNRILAN